MDINMKKKSSYLKLLLIMILCCMISVIPVQASSKKTTAKWATAYLKVIKKLNRERYPGTKYTYDLIYFNNDRIPELVAGMDGYWVSMYTYSPSKKKVYTVIDQWGYGAMGNAGYSYLPKKNTLYNQNSDYAGALNYVYYGKMKNYKIVSRYSKELKIQYFKDKNNNHAPDSNEYVKKPFYYYGNKRITKKKFDTYKIKGNYKTLIGSVSYNTMKKKLIAKGAK